MSPAVPTRDGASARWAEARNILAVRLDNLGDVLMATPALAAILETLPAAKLTLLGSPAGAALVRHLPMIDAVIGWRAPWVRHATPSEHDLDARRFVDEIGARAFDAAVIFTTCTQSALPAALMCQMAGIPLRLAYSRENTYDLLSDWAPETDQVADGMRHEVTRQLALVAKVGFTTANPRLRFALDRAAHEAAAAALRAAGLEAGGRYVVVHPGATAASRRYPAAAFGAAADLVAQRSGRTIVFSGGAGDRALVDTARQAMHSPSVALCDALDLGGLGALIANADLLIANNSGPVHVAAALGTPVVDLYALTNPQHTPWLVPARVLNHAVPCRHCLKSVCPQGHHDCLRKVEPEAVAAAAMELLSVTPRTRISPTPSAHIAIAAASTVGPRPISSTPDAASRTRGQRAVIPEPAA